MSRHHHHYPYVLQKFTNLPGGKFGILNLIARSDNSLEVALGDDFVQLNRDDAQEAIRVLSAWLAGTPVDTQVVHTQGSGSTVEIVDHGPGTPDVILRNDRPEPPGPRHFEQITGELGTAPVPPRRPS